MDWRRRARRLLLGFRLGLLSSSIYSFSSSELCQFNGLFLAAGSGGFLLNISPLRTLHPALWCRREQHNDVLIPRIEHVWNANMRVYGADKVWKQLN